MELRHLRYFVTAAEELNFTRAAARLHVSQPPLSRQIQDLEREIGAMLFDRSNNKLQLTHAGKAFLESAKQILAHTVSAARLAKAVSQQKHGQLTLGILSPLGGLFLPPALRALRQRFPLVDVTILEMVPRKQIEALLDNGIDVGFVPRSEAQGATELSCEMIADVGVLVGLPPQHPLATSRRIPFQKLAKEPFVVFKRSSAPATHDWIRDLCRANGFEPKIAKQCDQAQAILDSIAAGIGVSILPEFFGRYQSEVVFRPLEPNAPKIELCMVWRKRDRSEVLRSARAILTSTFQEQLRLGVARERRTGSRTTER
jgi:DNA-binding transcriptional LysR family regulator